MSISLLLVSAAALLDKQGRILVQQRLPSDSMAGLWEFPGGKIEPQETPEIALVRELREELGIVVSPAALTPIAFASAPLDERHLVLLLYLLREWQGEPIARQASALQWVALAQLRTLAMPPADAPLIEQLEAVLGAESLNPAPSHGNG